MYGKNVDSVDESSDIAADLKRNEVDRLAVGVSSGGIGIPNRGAGGILPGDGNSVEIGDEAVVVLHF